MLTRSPIRVCVVYASDWSKDPCPSQDRRMERLVGSDLLRYQMKDLLVAHLPAGIQLSFGSFAPEGHDWDFDTWLSFQRPAVFILLKNVGYHMTAEQLMRLRKKAIAVGMDHKDGDLAKIDLSLFDFHISASARGLKALNQIIAEDRAMTAKGIFADVLFQTPDARLADLSFTELDGLSAVYLGQKSNAAIPESIGREIDVVEVSYGHQMAQALTVLPSYNLHFAVRPTPEPGLRRRYKPFTKGFTAAACRSNLLVNRQVDDAVEFLTADYPYLIRSNDPVDVEDAFRKAREEFAGPEWRRGIEILRDVRSRISGAALADQLGRIVTRAAQ